MAHTSWNKIDKIQYEFQEHICAFLDILGYKEKSKDFFSGKVNLFERINRAMKQSGVEINREDSADEIITQIFSDSIIIHTSIENIDILLNYVAIITTYFSYETLFLRGGISSGKYFEDYQPNNYSFFTSEALIKAYEIENQANYPLIEIDKGLLPKIKNQNIIIDFNDRPILNFARYIINEFGNNQEEVFAEIIDIEVMLKDCKNSKVSEKIQWLLNYYIWFIEISNKKYNGFNMDKFQNLNIYKMNNLNFKEKFLN